jgi:putative membrane protein insertion efficiency factor
MRATARIFQRRSFIGDLRQFSTDFMTRILLATLAFYRRWISPALHSLSPGGCKFLPSCSEYASIAIATHGPLRGVLLAFWRLLRCHPFTRGGLDPVPPVAISRHFPHQPLP